jgi:hypothetical protein
MPDDSATSFDELLVPVTRGSRSRARMATTAATIAATARPRPVS